MKRIRPYLRLAPFLAAALALASCDLSDGPSTETGNPNLSGNLVDAQGRAAPGSVKLYVLPPAPDPAVQDTLPPVAPVFLESLAIGANGRYRFDSLSPARYALEGRDRAGSAFALVRDLKLASGKDTLIRDLRLSAPGRLSGRVTRGPNPRPAGVAADENILVRLAGADRYAITDSAGRYRIGNVPAGVYRMAFAAADGHYLTRYLDSVAVDPGAETGVPDVELEWSRFLAPSAVGGIAIAIDSAAGVARLSWRPVRLSGSAPVLYAVSRDGAELWRGPDTAYVDSLAGLPAGTPLRYAVVAINPLGQAGPADTVPAITPPPPPPPPPQPEPGDEVLEGVVLHDNEVKIGARLYLYQASPAPASPTAPPAIPRLLDSVASGAGGRFGFTGLGPGRYTVVARVPPGTVVAAAAGLLPRRPGARLDTLRLAIPGWVEGFATRGSIWVTGQGKGDDGIYAGLAGLPCSTLTEYAMPPAGGKFRLSDVPAGTYTLVVYARPEGFFLADSIPVTVRAGQVTTLPEVLIARYNPDAAPPKISSLEAISIARARVQLAWQPVMNYPALQGYRVLRLAQDLKVLDSSAVLTGTEYSDDVSRVAAGTVLRYVVRVVATGGREGENGGGPMGFPVAVTVPMR